MTVKQIIFQPSHTRIDLEPRKIVGLGLSESVKEAYHQAQLPAAAEISEIEVYLQKYWYAVRQENYETELFAKVELSKEPVIAIYSLGITPDNAFRTMAWWEADAYCTLCHFAKRDCENEIAIKRWIKEEKWIFIERMLANASGNIMMIALQSTDGKHLSGFAGCLWTPYPLLNLLKYYFQGIKPSLDSFEGEMYAYFLDKMGYFN